ncbi:MAG: hypothetical protein KAV87_41120 [Desulfobacteraceae bacterium]|nr:hypothetical protein [Desulfobacteraceae bacterium]
MSKQYLIDALPEEFRGNEFDMGVPVGVYFNPASSNLIIQTAKDAMPTIWPLGAAILEEAPEFVATAALTPGVSLEHFPAPGYPIEDVVKIIEAART